jgi:uncharacterized repeat protein (TIGR03803 family)
MQRNKGLTILASALIIAAGALTLSGVATASPYKIIHNFELPKDPSGNLTIDAAGNLYSTTSDGGGYEGGAVFKLAPNQDGTWAESVLHSFTGGADGLYPFSGLVFDAAGNLYGTTSFGGDLISLSCYPGCGVVFKLTPTSSGWSETVLHTFWGYGRNPSAGVIMDAAGNLYGTTGFNPSGNNGLVFEITP